MPGPPYARPYNYFVWDATLFIQAHRPAWTADDERHTVATLWHGDAALRVHYGPHKKRRVSPGFPPGYLFPANSYTQADANHARGFKTLPPPAAAPQPVVVPLPAVVAPQPLGMAVVQQIDIAPVQHQEPPAGVNGPDRRPYAFWPSLPWRIDPELPTLDINQIRENSRQHRNVFLNTDLLKDGTEDESWHGAKLLGAGGYGVAGLWVQLSKEGNIVDRVVVKETASAARVWRDPKNWRDQLPKEIRIHQLLEERREADAELCRHIVRYRGHRVFMPQRRHRIYMDFANANTHWEGIENYHRNWAEPRRANFDENKVLPEEYIWYTLRALAQACLVLHMGTTDVEAIEGWKPITHLDLMLSNILLHVDQTKAADSDHTDGSWTIPPIIPILMDFGLSFFSPDTGITTNLDNPEDYIFNKIATRYPPEHQSQQGPNFTPLGEKTDVWGLGSVAWSLLVNQTTRHGPVRDAKVTDRVIVKDYDGFVPLSYPTQRNRPKNDETTTLTGEGWFRAPARYSDHLKTLVRQCLNYSPHDRPTLNDIIFEAEMELSSEEAADVLSNLDGLGLRHGQDGKSFDIGRKVNRITDWR
ncbi:kinase-like domain-containing protein [Paraphoma chrysanthemicola]|uniref:non-specific serine/threonine protein kinase n=1 Tax=Paraphoma chrysanthemicola TaxID=798071 RepID=A0A8K0W3C3_9PLEO|nr:kinase-like domain-containing protein [Paraphoma chrysanthemicola]